VNTLDVEGIEAADLLTTHIEKELGRVGILREKTSRVRTRGGDARGFDPYVAQKITLGLDGDGHFGTRTERTDVIDTLGLDGEVRMTLVVLTEKTDFGLTSNVDILGTLGHEVNQSG
jgi:hypothetical protein